MRKLNRLLDDLLYAGTALSSLAFFIIIIIAVASRYILKTPILASIELSRLFFVWACFLAAAIGYRRRAHVAITFIYEKFPDALQRLTRALVHVIVLLFSGLIFYHSLTVNTLFWNTELPMLQISQSWFYVPIPIVFFCIICFALEFLWDELTESEV